MNTKGVTYDKEILEKYSEISNEKYVDTKNNLKSLDSENSEFVDLIVYLNNASDFNDIFSHFSEKDIKRISQGEFSPDFIGLSATKLVFDELVNDSRIKSIYYDKLLKFSMQETSLLINATSVWNLNPSYTGDNVKVCIIDSDGIC